MDHYAACMIARSYTANASFDELGWIVGVAQTRPHEASVVKADLTFCDGKADNAKASDTITLTPEQEASIAGRAFMSSVAMVPGMAYQQRPNAKRVLVACLNERGYEIRPWLPLNGAR